MDRSLEHLVRETAVHRSVYLDPDIFACELERIFGSTWIYVAHESEIPEAGDFKRATIGANPVIVVRGVDREVHTPRGNGLPSPSRTHQFLSLRLPRLDLRSQRKIDRCAVSKGV